MYRTLTFNGLHLSEGTFYEFHSTLVGHVDFTATGDFGGLLKDKGILAWESFPFCVLRIPICPAENPARQTGTPDKIR